ncbi:MAG: DUF2065 domain-containing protein [Kangiellaceae bacterium]|nr:DUF2065 domain-containing protein [Kangiellaceae bacterium]
MSKEWLIAGGLFLILEGLMPALMPKAWKQTMQEISQKSDATLRAIGFSSMLLGLVWIYFVV